LFGKKFGKHLIDFGNKPLSLTEYHQKIIEVYYSSDATIIKYSSTSIYYRGEIHIIQNNVLIRVSNTGNFISTYPINIGGR